MADSAVISVDANVASGSKGLEVDGHQHPTFHSRAHISVGDLVILFMTRDVLKAITVTPGEVFHNKFGRYTHESLVGVKYGTKVHSAPPHGGYLYVLRPTPELWTLSLPHRTQILYTPDIAYITMRLGVRPGGKVLEAGTGSGSMTHALSRSVGENGRVLSYEYHESRYGKAKEEFEGHGLKNVTLAHRNVCKDGFGDVDKVEGVFLDLPAPWEAIPHATKIMRPDIITRICCFSPCLEQVLRTVTTLRAEGYTDISTQEVLVRTHEIAMPSSSSSSRLSSVTEIVSRLKAHEQRKEERRVIQMKTAREKSRQQKEKVVKTETSGTAPTGASDRQAEGVKEDAGEKTDELVDEMSTKAGEKRAADEITDEVTETKKRRLDGNTTGTANVHQHRDQSRLEELQAALSRAGPSRPSLPWTEPEPYAEDLVLTKPAAEMRGHTSYLTFATLYPLDIRIETAPREPKSRVGELREAASAAATASVGSPTETSGSEYGSEGIDEALRTMTEEEMIALAGDK